MDSEKSTKRAIRRSQRERMLKKSYNLDVNIRYTSYFSNGVFTGWKNKSYPDTLEGRKEWAKDAAPRLADNMKSCSCYLCGNARRHFGTEKVCDMRQYQREENEIQEFFEEK